MKNKIFLAIFAILVVFSFSKNASATAEAVKVDFSRYEGDDISAVLNTALANDKHIIISKGNYTISDSVRLRDGNILDLGGSTITSTASKPYFLNNGGLTQDVVGYNGNDFTLKNGTLISNGKTSIISIGHAPSGLIEDIAILNTNGDWHHAIEISGSKGVVLRNSTFRNQEVKAESVSKMKELIQIEYSEKGGFGHFGAWDGTPSSNILIENNTFENFHVAIGNHYTMKNLVNNITIKNNTFGAMLFPESIPVRLYGFEGVEFINNTFQGDKLYIEEKSSNVVVRNSTSANFVGGDFKAKPSTITISDKQQKIEKVQDLNISAPNTGSRKGEESGAFVIFAGVVLNSVFMFLATFWKMKSVKL